MRIIGGRLKGKTILPPQGYKARPTTDFAKEGLFNVLNNEYEMEGLQVLDLLAEPGQFHMSLHLVVHQWFTVWKCFRFMQTS